MLWSCAHNKDPRMGRIELKIGILLDNIVIESPSIFGGCWVSKKRRLKGYNWGLNNNFHWIKLKFGIWRVINVQQSYM